MLVMFVVIGNCGQKSCFQNDMNRAPSKSPLSINRSAMMAFNRDLMSRIDSTEPSWRIDFHQNHNSSRRRPSECMQIRPISRWRRDTQPNEGGTSTILTKQSTFQSKTKDENYALPPRSNVSLSQTLAAFHHPLPAAVLFIIVVVILKIKKTKKNFCLKFNRAIIRIFTARHACIRCTFLHLAFAECLTNRNGCRKTPSGLTYLRGFELVKVQPRDSFPSVNQDDDDDGDDDVRGHSSEIES